MKNKNQNYPTYESRWLSIAKEQLLNRKIVGVRYLGNEERDALGWSSRTIVLILDDGNLLFPASDEEGNDGGVLFTNNEMHGTIPSLHWDEIPASAPQSDSGA